MIVGHERFPGTFDDLHGVCGPELCVPARHHQAAVHDVRGGEASGHLEILEIQPDIVLDTGVQCEYTFIKTCVVSLVLEALLTNVALTVLAPTEHTRAPYPASEHSTPFSEI